MKWCQFRYFVRVVKNAGWSVMSLDPGGSGAFFIRIDTVLAATSVQPSEINQADTVLLLQET